VRSARQTGAVTDVARDGTTVVVARDLRMAYGDHEAIRGIDLDVRRGEVFALVGPAGAGKTTTLDILEGYRRPTGGRVSVLGSDPASAGPAWRSRIGVVLQAAEPESRLTVRECLRLYAGYYERPRPIEATMELVGLADSAGTRAGQLSCAHKRLLAIALAIVGDPELVFVDEPTAGLDRAAQRSALSVVARVRDLGTTIFVAADSMREADALADRIAILSAGRIVASGTPRTLAARDATSSRISFTLPPTARVCDLPEAARVGAVVDDARRVTLRSTVPMTVLGALAPWSQEHGWPLRDIEVRQPSLEDFYLELTAGSR
jgi:ABC-2 type transport system ATP-binding protein